MGTEIFFTDKFYKAALLHRVHGLLVDMREHKLDPGFFAPSMEFFKGVHSGSVKCRNTAHPQDYDFCALAEIDGSNLVSCTEEERTGNLIYTDMLGQGF